MRRMNNALFASLFVLAALPAVAQATMKPQEVVRLEQGNRIAENERYGYSLRAGLQLTF